MNKSIALSSNLITLKMNDKLNQEVKLDGQGESVLSSLKNLDMLDGVFNLEKHYFTNSLGNVHQSLSLLINFESGKYTNCSLNLIYYLLNINPRGDYNGLLSNKKYNILFFDDNVLTLKWQADDGWCLWVESRNTFMETVVYWNSDSECLHRIIGVNVFVIANR